MSNNCLVILNPRDVRVAKNAIADLDIAKLWLTGYSEAELAESVFSWAIEESHFDNYLCISDDAILRAPALEAIVAALDGGCEVATGYSQRSHTDWTVNVTSGPLRDTHPTVDAYDFRQFREVVSWPEPLVPTWFVGMSATGMSREMWRKYPFGCFTDGDRSTGYASDFHLSRRLQNDRVPVYAVREAFCYHWRNEWRHTNHPDDDKVLVGQIDPFVTLVPANGLVLR